MDHIKLSQKERDQLITLKRNTGIQNWNVLCRWAFCLSIAEPSPPPKVKIQSDSSVEMTWKIFGGEYHAIYLALLKHRCIKEGIDMSDNELYKCFRFHLHRGIGYLSSHNMIDGLNELLLYGISN